MDKEPAKHDVADLLLEQGKLDAKQLEQVRRRQQRLNIPQHRAIIELNCTSEEDTYRALATLNELDFVDPAQLSLNPALLEIVPVKLIFHYHMVPALLEGEVLTLIFSEPPRQMELGNLRLLLGKRIKVALATPSSIHAAIKKHFGLGAETIQRLRADRGLGEFDEEIVFDVKPIEDDSAVDSTIADFVDQILLEALRLQATDIHLEPYHAAIRLKYRIDGLLQNVPVPTGLRPLHGAIVSRLKIMAGLNIAEKRLPHDGRIAMKTGGEDYDLRVSVIPTKHGEAVCLRILGRQSLFLDLNQLGMEPEQEALFADLTRLPQGMVLLTGPTGSGKTTTLYAALAHANDGERKIITIEDPIEYQLEGITQIQVRDDIGLSFTSGLRSVLRHDPDVVLIGEIRDAETAEIAVRAAQTGHLVFSTLHTNDSVSSVTRLLEMRIEAYLVSSSMVCSIAQRLVRRICRHCGEADPDIPDDAREEMARALKIAPTEAKAWKGRGCEECLNKGARGRVAIYEFFVINEELADLIAPGVRATQLREAARRFGWRSLREQGWVKVQAGLIPISEQQRMTRQVGLNLLAAVR
jgi:type II secretory ATPase GspE/PulE/Tfp pilus assembly ATPase PilB-like protein